MAMERWRPFGTAVERWEPFHHISDIQSEVVSVSITGDRLTVRGERNLDRDLKDEGHYRLERVYGRFERSIPLPIPVHADEVKLPTATACERSG